jgi:hypothetical protein
MADTDRKLEVQVSIVLPRELIQLSTESAEIAKELRELCPDGTPQAISGWFIPVNNLIEALKHATGERLEYNETPLEVIYSMGEKIKEQRVTIQDQATKIDILRSTRPEDRSREQGAGSREQGAGSREQGAGSREQGAGSRI